MDAGLVGKWTSGSGADVASLEIKADGSAVMDGAPITLQAEGGKMKLTYQAGVAVDATYKVSGSTLEITILGDTETWQRAGGAPATAAPVQPVAAATGGNPLASKKNPLLTATPAPPPAHPAAGTWNEGQLTLTLNAAGEELQGELKLGDQKYPTTASGSGATIHGTFVANGDKFMYAAKVAGDTMEFQSDGQTYQLKRQGAAPETARRNPLAPGGGNTATTAAAGAVVPAVDTTKGNWLRRPDEGFDLLLPGDFRVLREQGGGVLLGSNVTPGLILVFPSASGTAADLEKAQKLGVQDQTINMTPTGTIREASLEGGTGKLIAVAGTLEQTQVQGLLGAYLRAEGTGGLAVLAATTPASWPALKPFAEQAMGGVRFYKPQVSERLLRARQALAGHSLVTSFNNSTVSQNSSGYYTGSSVNSFRAWHCCSTGRCRYEGSRSSSFRGGGIIGSSESSGGPADGKWELQAQGSDFLLTFRFDDGSSASWTVSVDANENVFVDGTRVKVTTDSICDRL
ncbi:MAG TPA: hypothetical protein VG734_27045 [Lacunisphaera sp.]|nr:hypothetical protein [Lacunisphaera sp.]